MYLPKPFEQSDPEELYSFIGRYSFATLVSSRDGRHDASHLPFVLKREPPAQPYLLGHMAKANSHHLRAEGEVLVLFQGPHSYISPAWYGEKNTVPTWNYLAVHVTGRYQPLEEKQSLLEILRETVHANEAGQPSPWTMDLTPDSLDKMLSMIVGFRIDIDHIEGKWKLSQNHSPARRAKVIQNLREIKKEGPQEIARLMEELPGSR